MKTPVIRLISTWVVVCDLFVAPVVVTARTENLGPPASTTTTSSSSTSTNLRHVRFTQTDVKPYQLLSSNEIYDRIQEFKETYPEFLRVTTSQERYGLPAAGTTKDCPFVEGQGCPNFILEIQDYTVHPVDSASSNDLPSVLWSGCLHGDERVGPTATMEAVALLLEAAQCESTVSHACRATLKGRGIDHAHRKWLARLVTTRRIVVLPASNALGYFRNEREEGDVDPNRDFPYDLQDNTKCMQTIAARTLNELYRDNLFQLALTFHAGMEVVGYEWGAPTWLNHFSPDHTAQDSIASAYSRYGGGWGQSRPYQYGTMNDLVYYVRGGMEDWAYAASWDPQRVVQCKPKTFGGYPAEKTVYNNSTLRVFNMLIETSDKKTPDRGNLGTSLDVLSSETAENGHVSRNIRLALLSAELVEPYVSIIGIDELTLQDDLPPLRAREGRTCQRQPFLIAKDAKQIEIRFSVGGAMTINDVSLWFAKWDDIPEDQLDCLSQPSSTDGFLQGEIVGARNGTGYFSVAGSYPQPTVDGTSALPTIGPIFKGEISLPKGLKPWDRLVVLASARVDQQWASIRSNVAPQGVGPQSHVVNARTNKDWYHTSSGKRIQGRLDWFSTPLTVVIGDFEEGVGTHVGDGLLVKTVEMNPRFTDGASKSGLTPKLANDEQLWFPVSLWYTGAILLLVVAVCCICGSVLRRILASRRQKAMNGEYNQDDAFNFDPEPYTDEYADDDDADEVDDDDEEDEEEEVGMELPTLS